MAPPPYSRLVMNLERPGRLAVVSRPVESLETGGTNQYSSSNTNLGNVSFFKIIYITCILCFC